MEDGPGEKTSYTPLPCWTCGGIAYLDHVSKDYELRKRLLEWRNDLSTGQPLKCSICGETTACCWAPACRNCDRYTWTSLHLRRPLSLRTARAQFSHHKPSTSIVPSSSGIDILASVGSTNSPFFPGCDDPDPDKEMLLYGYTLTSTEDCDGQVDTKSLMGILVSTKSQSW